MMPFAAVLGLNADDLASNTRKPEHKDFFNYSACDLDPVLNPVD